MPALQTCPAFVTNARSDPGTALAMSASAKTRLGDLPPSSRVRGRMRSAAIRPISLPARSEPVNATLRTSGCSTIAAPTSGPVPVTTLKTPAGSPHSTASRASSSVLAEVNSDGLATTTLPAASAGAMPRAAWLIGAFQGVITPTTPKGSRSVYEWRSGATWSVSPPSVWTRPP